MSSVKLTCPQCQAPLRFLKAPTPGKAIRCPGCQLKFVPPEAAVTAAGPSAAQEAQEAPWTSALGWLAASAALIAMVIAVLIWRPWSGGQTNIAAPTVADAGLPIPSTPDQESSAVSPAIPFGSDPPVMEPMSKAPKTLPPESNKPAPAAKAQETKPLTEEQPLPTPPSPVVKKSPPKTYAETKRPKDFDAPPALVTIKTTPAHPMQAEIDAAIARGIGYLRRAQFPVGTWTTSDYPVGYAALGGLTLLEGGIPADDPGVQRAADYVRKTPITLNRTYQTALIILFLDRLGDERDGPFIMMLAMQLIAGQTQQGSWGYELPAITAEQAQQMAEALRTRTPKLGGAGEPQAKADKRQPAPAKRRRPEAKKAPGTAPFGGPSHPLLDIPLFQSALSREDNSNTQFALLALWAARRHGVPAEFSLLFAAQRLAATQNPDGGWGYSSGSGTTPAMTCVGLLGLAMGHGLSQPQAKKEAAPADPRIQAGLKRLGAAIEPSTWRHLYFAWSLERVGVLYQLSTIGNKDWYDLGVHQLLKSQGKDGSWSLDGYPGSSAPIDTCFAILFLKRANLVQDLSERLPLFMAISDPDAGPRR